MRLHCCPFCKRVVETYFGIIRAHRVADVATSAGCRGSLALVEEK
jgi:hypothetical protein